jgi:hypothetical protein
MAKRLANAPVAQWIERGSPKAGVAGSTPARGTHSLFAAVTGPMDTCCRVGRRSKRDEGGSVAVGIRIKLAGVTQDTFDEVDKHVRASGDVPKGLLFHASGPIDEGWGVIDFWESRADFDAFFGSRVQEAVKAAGVEMQGPPDVKEFPVHETWQP